MFVTYQPEDGDAQRWEFNPRRVRASEAEVVEKKSGQPWDQWLVAVQQGSIKARRILLWWCMTRDHPTLRIEDTPDFYAGEVELEYSAAELTEVVDQARGAGLVEDGPEMRLLQAELAKAAARDEPGKASSRPGANGTGSRSPKSSGSARGSSASST